LDARGGTNELNSLSNCLDSKIEVRNGADCPEVCRLTNDGHHSTRPSVHKPARSEYKLELASDIPATEEQAKACTLNSN